MMTSALLALALTVAPTVDAESCRDATASYQNVISDLSIALRRYTSCLVSSKGTDDCYTEFRRVKNAQSDYESAVSAYKLECI